MRMRDHSRKQSGQALLMVTLAAIPMFAMVGLVVDLGYMQYMKKSTQAVADAAAYAAAIAFHSSTSGSSFSCGGSIVCQSTPQYCDPSITTASNAIDSGCLYAKQNGFVHSDSQDVTYTAGVSASPHNGRAEQRFVLGYVPCNASCAAAVLGCHIRAHVWDGNVACNGRARRITGLHLLVE